MTRATYLLIALCCGACRLAGPDGDHSILSEEEDGGPPSDDDSMMGEAMLDARAPDRTDARVVDSGEARDAAQDASARDASAASCGAPRGLACNPVSGEGCLPLMQCVADPASSSPSAYCAFGVPQLGMTCTQDAFSTSCPPQHTCVMGQCLQACFCDTDCGQGVCAARGGNRFCEGG